MTSFLKLKNWASLAYQKANPDVCTPRNSSSRDKILLFSSVQIHTACLPILLVLLRIVEMF